MARRAMLHLLANETRRAAERRMHAARYPSHIGSAVRPEVKRLTND